MSMKQYKVSVDIDMDSVIEAIMNDLTQGEMIDFVDELIETVSDGDFTNELYELLRRKHEEWLDVAGVDESQYREEFADPTLYPEVEDDDFDDDEEDDPESEAALIDAEEPWTTDEEDDGDVDVFNTNG